MVKPRTLDRRRKSIRNIRKITRTMELIATARFKRAMDRAVAATAYTKRITALVEHVARSGTEVAHPLLEPRPEPQHATLLVLTANRGLCGGYNAAVLRLASDRWDQLQQDVPHTRLEVVGKRGISAFRFHQIVPDEQYTHFDDRPQLAHVEQLANRYMDEFRHRRLDRLEIAYTRFENVSRQQAVIETLLPLAVAKEDRQRDQQDEQPAGEVPYEFFPSAESILEEVVPASFRTRLFKCFLDAAVSEQIARMLAMKAATENADTMIRTLTMTYNRARQTLITSEILEVVSGAEALQK